MFAFRVIGLAIGRWASPATGDRLAGSALRNALVRGALGLLLACLALVSPALAQTGKQTTGPGAATTPGQAEQEALFQRILKEPANLDLAFRHAELSTANGDYEAAIGSLERLLFFNPNLPRVMVELGVLYFRLGSYEMSREYFTKAIAPSDTPAEVRTRVEAYLTEIEKRLNPSLTTGFAQTGVRYQTNANAGPNDSTVRVFGFNATLDKEFEKQSDRNWFAQGIVRNVIDFGNQRGDAWESSVAGYLTRHKRFGRLDTALLDFQTGPRLAVLPDHVYGLSYRPYVGLTGINLGGFNYLSQQTYGNALNYIPTPGWSFEIGVERIRREFHNSEEYPNVEIQSGTQYAGYINLAGPLMLGWNWQARGTLADHNAEAAWQSYRQRGVDVSLSYATNVHLFGASRRFTFIPFAGYLETMYDEPDFTVDPTTERRDRERKAGIALDVLLGKQFGIAIRLQHTDASSSLPNFETKNTSVFGGPTWRF
jgi:tetratricopeptide (TPR) repeat protein